MIPRNILKWLGALGIACIAALVTSFAILLNGSHGQVFAFALIAGASGFSASLTYLLYRLCFSHQRRMARIEHHATTASASVWFDRVLEPRIPLPSLSGMVLQPETAGYLIRAVEAESAGIVLELGSGVSTLLVAYSMELRGQGLIYSFDSEAFFADRTRRLLMAHGLAHRAEVIHAPLNELVLEDWKGRWFQQAAFDVLPDNSATLLFVDGPPHATGMLARYPALPILSRKLKANSLVLVDDAERSHEEEMVDRWTLDGLLNAPQVLPIGTGLIVGRTARTA